MDPEKAACVAPKGATMKVLAVGDSYMPTGYFQQAFADLGPHYHVEYLQVEPTVSFTPTSPSERRIKEYQGSPFQLRGEMGDVEIWSSRALL